MFTIIARDCGIDRNYPCYTYAEAEFLFKALSAIAHRRVLARRIPRHDIHQQLKENYL